MIFWSLCQGSSCLEFKAFATASEQRQGCALWENLNKLGHDQTCLQPPSVHMLSTSVALKRSPGSFFIYWKGICHRCVQSMKLVVNWLSMIKDKILLLLTNKEKSIKFRTGRRLTGGQRLDVSNPRVLQAKKTWEEAVRKNTLY